MSEMSAMARGRIEGQGFLGRGDRTESEGTRGQVHILAGRMLPLVACG